MLVVRGAHVATCGEECETAGLPVKAARAGAIVRIAQCRTCGCLCFAPKLPLLSAVQTWVSLPSPVPYLAALLASQRSAGSPLAVRSEL